MIFSKKTSENLQSTNTMRKTIQFLTYGIFVLLLSISISSCKGDDGVDGEDGAIGATGTNGQDGNANVIYSDWFDPTWSLPAAHSNFTHAAPEITQEIFDTGVVMVYMQWFNSIYPLPISFPGDGIPKTFNFWAKLGELQIWFTAESSINNLSGQKYRYIIIPSNNVAARGVNVTNPKQRIYDELENAGVNINDYYAVCAYYGINPE